MYSSQFENDIPADKATRLLDILPKRGEKAFEIFYEAICQGELWDVADILKPDKAPHQSNASALAPRRNFSYPCK